MEEFRKIFVNSKVEKLKFNEPLKKHTTMKVGGPAAVFAEASHLSELQDLLAVAKKHDLQWKLIGRGSNLLAVDEGFPGLIIRLARDFQGIDFNNDLVRVGANYPLISLAMQAYRQGLSGLEFAAGIPASVGGAIFMNAGAHGSQIASVLRRVEVLFPDGRIKWLPVDELQLAYRTSIFQTNRKWIILSAEFKLESCEKEAIKTEMDKYKNYRQKTQPWDKASSGSVFRNPQAHFAAKLIEDANLKGYKIGGAEISTLHSNFIVNNENASAEDILSLISHIKRTVKDKFQISLETELEIIGKKYH